MTAHEHHALNNLLAGLKLVAGAAQRHLVGLTDALETGAELLKRAEALMADAIVDGEIPS